MVSPFSHSAHCFKRLFLGASSDSLLVAHLFYSIARVEHAAGDAEI